MIVDKKLILLVIVSVLSVMTLAVFFFTHKLKATKNMNFYNIQTIDDLHRLFPTSVEQIKEYSQICIQLIDEQVKEIIAVPDEQRNFENTARALDNIVLFSHPIMGAINSIEYVHPDKDMRQAAQEQGAILNAYLVDHVSSNVDLYKAFKFYAETLRQAQGERGGENLTDEQKYYVQETLRDFKKAGLELPTEQLEEVKKLSKELHVLTTQFQVNIASHKCKILVTRDELEGTTESFVNSLQQNEDGKYILGCDYPTYFAIADQCSVESTRKKMYLEFSNRAYPANIDLLNQIISKRDKMAKILGFKSYADLSISDGMAKSKENVEKFLNDLSDKAQKKAVQEVDMFLKNLPDSINLQDGKIKPWDFRYIKEMYRKKYLNLDDSKISEYFPMQNTVEQLFDIYQTLFNLKFEQIKVSGFWHQDVSLIKVYKKDPGVQPSPKGYGGHVATSAVYTEQSRSSGHGGQFLGYLFLDLYPRENKFTHAANATVVQAYKDSNGQNYPAVCIMLANFPKNTKDRPSLLKYKDVVTFFHEFGHALHAMLGITDIVSFSGTSVKRDFVEMPSQMLENWLKDEEILKKVSSHYKTGESLPDDIIEQIVDIDKFDSGDQTLKQIYYAFISLECFKDGEIKDTQAIIKNLYKNLLKHIVWQEDDHTQASFGHLMGYGPNYYGYLWSDVFATDLFEEIKKQGLLNPEVGNKYISNILLPGGSKDPNVMLKNFLAREPNQEAYLKSLGFE